jgi:hypothetical protein
MLTEDERELIRALLVAEGRLINAKNEYKARQEESLRKAKVLRTREDDYKYANTAVETAGIELP